MSANLQEIAKSYTSNVGLTGAIAAGVGTGVGIGTIGGPAGAIIGGAAGGAYGAVLSHQKKPVDPLPWIAIAIGIVVLMLFIAMVVRSSRKC